MSSILVTGRDGQLGFELRRTLSCLGRVQAIGRNDLDLMDLDAVRRFLRSARPDILVNAAAYNDVSGAESDRATATRINGELPGVLARELRQLGGQLMVHFSTDYVFDGKETEPYREDHATAPLNGYGESKLRGEDEVRQSGLSHVILRTQWLYSTRGANFALTVLRLAREGKPLRIIADQIGAPTWTRSLAEVTAVLISRWMSFSPADRTLASGVYHAASAGQTSWHRFAEAILREYLHRLRATNHRSDWCAKALDGLTAIASAEYPSAARRPQYSVLAGDKLERVFGLRMPDWREQLRLAFDEYLNPADVS